MSTEPKATAAFGSLYAAGTDVNGWIFDRPFEHGLRFKRGLSMEKGEVVDIDLSEDPDASDAKLRQIVMDRLALETRKRDRQPMNVAQAVQSGE